MEFKGLEKNSVIEWPGKVVSVAYTGGCNFRCPYCQNSDLVLRPDEVPTIEGEAVIEYLVSRRKWIDGLVITGGEPTLHHPSLFNFLKTVKEEGFDVGVETNGSNPEVLKELLEDEVVDYVGLDIKAPFEPEKYEKSIGVRIEGITEDVQECMNLVREHEIDYEYRTTVVPDILSPEDFEEIGKKIDEDEKYYLQQFVPENTLDDDFENVDPFEKKKLKEIQENLNDRQNLRKCEIRNI